MRSKFTRTEIEELVDAVSKNPENLTRVFKSLSEKWGTHSFGSIQQHYYRELRNTNACFMVAGKKRVYLNRKNVFKESTPIYTDTKKSFWDKLKGFFKL